MDLYEEHIENIVDRHCFYVSEQEEEILKEAYRRVAESLAKRSQEEWEKRISLAKRAQEKWEKSAGMKSDATVVAMNDAMRAFFEKS